MNAALLALQSGITNLRGFIEATSIEWKLLGCTPGAPAASPRDEHAAKLQTHVGAGVEKRRFDYNSVIVSLYGLLEQYVESLVRAYVEGLESVVPKYANLPDPIKNSHVSLSVNLVNKASQSRYRGSVTAEGLIANLHSCLSNASPYRVNADAFCQHSANFRAEMVDEVFAKVGVTGISQRLRLFTPFSEYLAQEYQDREPATIKPEEMYFYLNDLAERRNEVAHGAPSELLSILIQLEYVRFVECYCAALHGIAQCHFAEHLAKHRGSDVGTPIAVFNNSIVCFDLKNTRIARGDTLVAGTGNAERPFLIGAVEELQVDKVSHEIVPAAASVNVGVKVSFNAKPAYTYYLVPKA